MDIKTLITDIFDSDGLQDYINRRFKSDTQTVITNSQFKYIVRNDGCKFYIDSDLEMVGFVDQTYHYSDIKPDDIVIDLGASVGGFTIPAARISKNVYAFEPMTISPLYRNLALNGVTAKIFQSAISNDEFVDIVWKGVCVSVPGMSFDKIIHLAGGCDFLKSNCEGGEWTIGIDKLREIRRIEMCVHKTKDFDPNIVQELEKTHDVKLTMYDGFSPFCIHATRRD